MLSKRLQAQGSHFQNPRRSRANPARAQLCERKILAGHLLGATLSYTRIERENAKSIFVSFLQEAVRQVCDMCGIVWV